VLAEILGREPVAERDQFLPGQAGIASRTGRQPAAMTLRRGGHRRLRIAGRSKLHAACRSRKRAGPHPRSRSGKGGADWRSSPRLTDRHGRSGRVLRALALPSWPPRGRRPRWLGGRDHRCYNPGSAVGGTIAPHGRGPGGPGDGHVPVPRHDRAGGPEPRVGLTPVLFELGARPHPPQDVYRAYLAQSDVFIGLYWQRYGQVGPGMEISGLEEEFELSRGLPRLLYVKVPAPEREAPADRIAGPGRAGGVLPRVRHAWTAGPAGAR
jgi:Domain of unknown function (DUF4062)